MSTEPYAPSPHWHPAARDAYDERIAILMQSAEHPPVDVRRTAWIQAEQEDRFHKQNTKEK